MQHATSRKPSLKLWNSTQLWRLMMALVLSWGVLLAQAAPEVLASTTEVDSAAAPPGPGTWTLTGSMTTSFEWLHQFGTASDDEVWATAVDASGLYVAGSTLGTLPDQPRPGEISAFIRKYDLDGNELWTRQFGFGGAGGQNFANALVVDATGVYVAGSSIIPVMEVFPHFYPQFDAFVRKYDSNGNELWTQWFGSDYTDEAATALAVDSTGVYIAGKTGVTAAFVIKYDLDGNGLWTSQFGGSPSALAVGANGLYVAGYTGDAFVIKYDLDGNELWTRQFSTEEDDGASALAIDATGVYVAGYFFGVFTDHWLHDSFVIKYDPNGNELWTRQFGTEEDDGASALAVDTTGLYVAGSTMGALPGQTQAGNFDGYVRKYDSKGNELWTQQFGTESSDTVSALAVEASRLYLAGNTSGAFPGQTQTGDGDVYVGELNLQPSGSLPPPSTSSPLRLSLFTTETVQDGVMLHWETEAEGNNSGFNLYRISQDNGSMTKVNATLIPAHGTADTGATYDFVDRPGNGHYTYVIKNIDQQGNEHLRGQVEAVAQGDFLFVPSLSAP